MDPGSVAGFGLTATPMAFKSVESLKNAVARYQGRDKTLARLYQVLEDLGNILGVLEGIVDSSESTRVLLEGPVSRCSLVCREFETAMQVFGEKSEMGFLDWTRMEFMAGDINEFMDRLADYKATISVGLGTITMQTSRFSHKALEEYNEMVQDTSYNLNIRLQRLDEKIALLVKEKTSTAASDVNVDLNDERAVTEQCLRTCKDAWSYIESLTEQHENLTDCPLSESVVNSPSPFEAQILARRTLGDSRDSLSQTIDRLQELLESMTKNDPRYVRLQGESQTLKQCLELCKNAPKQVTSLADRDNDQLVNTTLADLFPVGKAWGSNTSAAYLGYISDETARDVFLNASSGSRTDLMTGSLKPFTISDTTFSETLEPLYSDTEGSAHPSSLSYNFRDRDRDQEAANGSTMTFSNYKRPESQDDAGDLEDDLQSVLSMPDDIGSQAESISNMSTFHHAAITFLVNTLTSNQELAALYKEATQRAQEAKFMSNHRRLLKQYFLKLREDGQEFPQKSAVEILRTRHFRTLISQEIWNFVIPSDSEERKFCVRSMDQGQDQLVMLDRFLRETGPLYETGNMDSNLDGPQSDSSSDEDEFEKAEDILTHLEAAREFFVSVQPFQSYKESLRQFIKPTPTLPGALRHVDTSLLGRRSTNPLATNLRQQFRAPPDSSQASGKTDFNVKTRTKIKDETKHPSRIQDSSSVAQTTSRPAARRDEDTTVFRILIKILSFLTSIGLRNADVAPGYRRVRWRNKRGKWLYDDYIERGVGALHALQGYLTSSTYVSTVEPSTETSHPSANAVAPGSSTNQLRGSISGSLDIGDQMPSNFGVTQCSSSLKDPEKGNSTENTLHVLCCVDQRKRAVVLHEELITDITDDRHLFQALHDSYRKHKGKFKHYWSLRAIQSIHFMKFAYGGRPYIDVRCHHEICEQGKPCICLPPLNLVRPVGAEYECSPIPSKLSPPIGPRLVKDLFDHPEDIDPNSDLVLRQLPKWACGNLPSRPREIKETWGIYYQEGWDWTRIWWVLGLGFFPPSLLFGIFWGILKQDVQGAFGIASWWMTGAAIIIGIVGTNT